MAMMRANPRLQVGSAPWISEERASALQIAEAEAEEFTFSARNEVEWLNEHMAEIFSENNVNVAEIFKTPGKLRGKTPRTVRKVNPLESRLPLSDVFSATPRGAPSPFKQSNYQSPKPTFQVAEDEPVQKDSFIIPEAAGPVSPIQRKLVPTNHFDSGYFGSQAVTATQPNEAAETQVNQVQSPQKENVMDPEPIEEDEEEEDPVPNRESTGSFESAKEEMPIDLPEEMEVDTEVARPNELEESTRPVLESPLQTRVQQASSPQKRSPQRSPERPAAVLQSPPKVAPQVEESADVVEYEPMEDVQSPTSDGSSPIRPIVVRKSSLNFASLPAREPITTKKSIGNRVSRTSQLDQTRSSYYGRATGGKSLGNARPEEDGNDDDDMDVDMDDTELQKDDTDSKMTRLHNKTSTQRLQDQISKLGQSQTQARPASKSIAGTGLATSQTVQTSYPSLSQEMRQKSPMRKAPGAFPDDEDSWIGPPTVAPREPDIFSPRPELPKSHSTDVMEGIHGKESISGADFNIPKRGEASPHRSPQRSPAREPMIPERTTSTKGHIKSVSTSVLRSPKKAGDSPGSKVISVSNPTPSMHTINEGESTTPPKSPSRSYRGSPLKAAKDKFSSILKTSRGLFASSAAVSAEAKTSTLSPPSNRPGVHQTPSFEDILSQSSGTAALYPTLSNSTGSQAPPPPQRSPRSPFKSSARKTRASTEREERMKEDQAREAREAKEVKEAQKNFDQLEKARMKVKEDARVYHLEQDRVAAMQKEVQARKEQEQQAKKSQVDIPRATRSSPRKTKAQLEAEGIAAAAPTNEDVEMSDASAMPPPARPKSQIGRPGPKRPLKPSKENLNKAKPPTVIRVDTGSQRGHQYHPSTSTLSATLQESLSAPGPSSQNTLKKKASTSSIQSKSSTNSFKSAASKALEAAARKKEQDELAAQRKKEAKQEVERQRAANKEEERRKEEQHRKQEAERQRELQRERERANAAADAKKFASRQAIEKRRQEMERAKQMGAPPPAVRPKPSGDLRHAMQRDKELPPVPVQRNEMAQSKSSRPQEDFGRSVNGGMQNPSKVPPKRPLQQEDDHSRPPIQRNAPSYHNEPHSKRRKTSEGFDDDDMEDHPKMTAPPIRQSSSRPKDFQTKSLFPSGYANAPLSNSLQRSTVISQHNMTQSKPAHPMDMAQVSKGPIPFASSSNQGNAQPHKTPARPGTASNNGKSAGKSTNKASPKYQNGENIELPEINTDSEDSDDEDKKAFPVSDWAASPVLREQLARQEPMDPSKIFGNPGPLNMEEVFSKSKDRFGKFRNRTSSANWSGVDRLTEDEIRKDLQARDKLRRQGGWTYDSMV